jgi:hypothetical protein
MGGHALSPGLTERKDLHDYLRIKQLVLDKLLEVNSQIIQIGTVIEVPEKVEFGDLDLIYYRLENISEIDVKSLIQKAFEPNEIFQCGNVTSFDFEHFQIDFIECDESTFELTRFCLSYGDRGMILGQIARWNGFSLGFQGLVITTEDLEALCEIKGLTDKVLLTIDPIEVRKIMGLPLNDDLITSSRHDIGLFCRQSTWFRPEIFTNKLNSEGKKRWAKRPYYRYFVEQIIAEIVTHYNLLLLRKQQNQEQDQGQQLQTGNSSLCHRLQSHLYHHIHSSHDLTTVYHSIHPLHSDDDERGDLYSHTPLSLLKEQRLTQIRFALTYFNKWNEIEEIQRRHFEAQQRREKLNFHHFMELGIPSDHLIIAKTEFLQWLMNNKSSSLTRDPPPPTTEVGNGLNEVELLSDETKESLGLKLKCWAEGNWQLKVGS